MKKKRQMMFSLPPLKPGNLKASKTEVLQPLQGATSSTPKQDGMFEDAESTDGNDQMPSKEENGALSRQSNAIYPQNVRIIGSKHDFEQSLLEDAKMEEELMQTEERKDNQAQSKEDTLIQTQKETLELLKKMKHTLDAKILEDAEEDVTKIIEKKRERSRQWQEMSLWMSGKINNAQGNSRGSMEEEAKVKPPQGAPGTQDMDEQRNDEQPPPIPPPPPPTPEMQIDESNPPKNADQMTGDIVNPCGLAHNMKLNASGFNFRSGQRKRQLFSCYETGMSCYFGYVSKLSGEIGPEAIISNVIGPRVDTTGILTCTRWNLHRCQRHYVHHKVQDCIRTHNCSLCHALSRRQFHPILHCPLINLSWR